MRNPLTLTQIAHLDPDMVRFLTVLLLPPPKLILGSLEFLPKFVSGGRFPRYQEKAQQLCGLRERKRAR